MNLSHPSLKWYQLSVLLIALDQLTKYLVLHFLALHQPVAILPFFNLTLMHNTGAAFSFLSQQPVLAFWLFSTIALLMSAVFAIWLARLPRENRWLACALSLVLGGALGNVIDRFTRGYVVDFLDFYYQGWHFPAFNIADSAITVGAALLILEAFFSKKRNSSLLKT